VIGAVLAGGRARRMGGVKPAALLGGRPLIAYTLDAVRGAGLSPVVVARPDTPLPRLDAPVIHDGDEVVHPFTGVVTALDHAAAPVVVVGADMPFLTSGLVAALAAHEGLVACRARGILQPLCARYAPAVRDALAAAAASGGPMRSTLESLAPAVLDVDPEQVASVNTPEDLAAAEARLSGR
jgi:molybdenum cofactor guanylyltransferase